MSYTPEQQKEHRKALVAALRSGKYEQTDGALHSSDSDAFCCLGVACDLAKEAVRGSWIADHSAAVFTTVRGGSSDSYLVSDVKDYYGFATVAGQFTVAPGTPHVHAGLLGRKTTLSELNDDLRLSFAEIADVIEHEPAGLIAA
jgi:hypothetical protein